MPLLSFKYDMVKVLTSKMSHCMSLYTQHSPSYEQLKVGTISKQLHILVMTSWTRLLLQAGYSVNT